MLDYRDGRDKPGHDQVGIARAFAPLTKTSPDGFATIWSTSVRRLRVFERVPMGSINLAIIAAVPGPDRGLSRVSVLPPPYPPPRAAEGREGEAGRSWRNWPGHDFTSRRFNMTASAL